MTRAAMVAVVVLAMLADRASAQRDKAASRLETLVEQLASPEPATRSQAYSALVRERDPEVVPLIGKRIGAMSPDGQQFALYVLNQHPIEVTRDLYTRLLGAERALLRAHSAAALVRGGDRSRLKALVDAVVAAPPNDRTLVLNTLWSIEDAALVDAVRGYVAPDAPVHVVVTALQHLQRLEKGNSAATDAAVRGLLAAASADVRAAGLAWLASGADGKVHATELAKLLAADPNRYWSIERLLVRDRKYPAELGDAFVAALADPRSRYGVEQAVPLVKGTAPDRLAATLRTLLAHANDEVRAAAIGALVALPGGLQAKELQQLLQSGKPEQQLVAAAVLRRMDDPSGLPVVLALSRQAGKHRAEAMRVLGGFRTRDAVPPLLDALDDADQQVRQNAWNALQPLLRDLFPYRRFQFEQSGYDPNAGDRAQGLATLRAWWASVR